MASTLNVTTTLSGDHWLITGSLADGGTLPKEIFIYTNTGDGNLGTFYGTCNVEELGKLQVLTLGQTIPLFGNKYVRYGQIKIEVPIDENPQAAIDALVLNVKTLSKAYAAQSGSSASYNIP